MTPNEYDRRTVLAAAAAAAIGASTGTAAGRSEPAARPPRRQTYSSSWPQWGFDAGGTRYSPDVEPPAIDLEHETTIDAGGDAEPIAVFGGDTVYACGEELVAADPDGTIQWSTAATGDAERWVLPAVGDDQLYATTEAGVSAVDPDSGDVAWTYEIDEFGGLIAVHDDGVVAFDQPGLGEDEGAIVAMDDGGNVDWEREVEGMGSGSLAGGRVLVTVETGLVAFDVDTGEPLWEHESAADGFGFFPVATAETVYYDDQEPHVYAIDATTGEELWRTEGELPIYPLLAEDRLLATIDGEPVTVDAGSGELLTEYDTEVGFFGGAAGDVGFGIDFGTGQLLSFTLDDGQTLDTYDVDTFLVVPTDDHLFAPTSDGELQVLVGEPADALEEGETDEDDPDDDGSEGDDGGDGDDDGSDGDDGGDDPDDGSGGDDADDDPDVDESQDDESDDEPGGADEDASPTAAFEFSPESPSVGETVEFDASDSEAADGSLEELGWSFPNDETASGEVVEYSFEDSGSRVVELTVADEDGRTDSTSDTVRVSADDDSIPGFGAIATLAGVGSVAGWLARRNADGDED